MTCSVSAASLKNYIGSFKGLFSLEGDGFIMTQCYQVSVIVLASLGEEREIPPIII